MASITTESDIVLIIEQFNGRSQWNKDKFTSGLCAAFALGLMNYLGTLGHDAHLLLMMRIERDVESGDVFSETFSHCVVCSKLGVFDIDGNNADERWVSQFGDESEIDEWGLVNDWSHLEFRADQIDDFNLICKKHNVSLSEADISYLRHSYNQSQFESHLDLDRNDCL